MDYFKQELMLHNSRFHDRNILTRQTTEKN